MRGVRGSCEVGTVLMCSSESTWITSPSVLRSARDDFVNDVLQRVLPACKPQRLIEKRRGITTPKIEAIRSRSKEADAWCAEMTFKLRRFQSVETSCHPSEVRTQYGFVP